MISPRLQASSGMDWCSFVAHCSYELQSACHLLSSSESGQGSIARRIRAPAGWRSANRPSISPCSDIRNFNQLTLAPSLQFSTAKGEHIMSVNSDFAIAQQTTKASKALNITLWGVQILT